MQNIILVQMSDFDRGIFDVLKPGLEETFRRPVETRVRIGGLGYAYDPIREQYKSPRLLPRLRRMKRHPGDRMLGIVDVDLYSPGFDYIYGEAEIVTGVGTLSLYRLHPEFYASPGDNSLFEDRAVKEAVHELGHLFGLGHCRDKKCVMRFCPELAHVDTKLSTFCSGCAQKLGAASR